jgi:thiol:disulfide interchange protein
MGALVDLLRRKRMKNSQKWTCLLFSTLLMLLPSILWSQVPEISTVSVSQDLEISVHYKIPEGLYQSYDPDFFFFEIRKISSSDGKAVEGVEVGKISYPSTVQIATGSAFKGETVLTAPLTGIETLKPGTYTGTVSAAYQLCNESGLCFIPGSTEASFSFTLGEGAKSFLILPFLTMLFFALLGGLLLNVMPCVFPILSIRALNLVKQSENSPGAIKAGALLYGAGVLTSFMVFALIVIVLKQTGELAGWGFQFQNPLFVFSLTAVLFLFALSLFDLFVFQPPAFVSRIATSHSRGLAGSYFNGLFAVILATPCTAPFLGSALGFAFSQAPASILLFFVAISIGFALPFVLLGFFPKVISLIPKPGAWMTWFKEIMGLVLFGTALYFFHIFSLQVERYLLIRGLAFLLSLAAAAWFYGKMAGPAGSSRKRHIALILFFLIPLASALFLFYPGYPGRNGVSEALASGPEKVSFDPALIEELRSENSPVFLAFSAQWCSVCKLNERRILHTPLAKELFSKYDITYMYGDFTREDPVIAEWISRLGRAGVPVYAFYRPGAENPLLLPELLSFEILDEAFEVTEEKTLDSDIFF